MPAIASYAASPCTSARSSFPSSSSGMFSALPFVLRASIVMAGSASCTAATKASPETGKPPPGVAVPSVRVTGVFDMGATAHEPSTPTAIAAARLFNLDIRVLHDPGPLGEVVADVAGELVGRAARRFRADLGEPRANGGLRDHPLRRGVELVDDLARRARRRDAARDIWRLARCVDRARRG